MPYFFFVSFAFSEVVAFFEAQLVTTPRILSQLMSQGNDFCNALAI